MRTAEKEGAFISCLPVLVKAIKRPQMGMDREGIEWTLIQLGLLVQHVDAQLRFLACRGISARADHV